MIYKGFKALKIRVDRGVAFVTIDNPPMKVLHAINEKGKK